MQLARRLKFFKKKVATRSMSRFTAPEDFARRKAVIVDLRTHVQHNGKICLILGFRDGRYAVRLDDDRCVRVRGSNLVVRERARAPFTRAEVAGSMR